MKKIAIMLAVAVILLAVVACGAGKGSITVHESNSAKEVTAEFSRWNGQEESELSLNDNDELQVEVACESGSVSLDIRAKSGTEVYTGNGLDTCQFTVTVHETDVYVITMEGDNASGSARITNVSE